MRLAISYPDWLRLEGVEEGAECFLGRSGGRKSLRLKKGGLVALVATHRTGGVCPRAAD